MASMYYVGLDVHKKTISYCVKDVNGQVHAEDVVLQPVVLLQAVQQLAAPSSC